MIPATITDIAFRRVRRIARQLRRLWWWVRRHPRLMACSVVVGWFVAVNVALMDSAVADTDSDTESGPSLPFLAPLNPTDSHGVDLRHYATLPLQRGDLIHPDQQAIAFLIDGVWTFQITVVSWALWLFELLLSFEWVQWLAIPIGAIITFLAGLIGQIGWVPLALAISAVVCGAVVMAGRTGAGVAEVIKTIIAAAFTATLLLNPLGLVTGPNGVLQWAQDTGGGLAASVASTEPRMVDGADASQVLTDTITTQLMDVWVRGTAQEIAFGKILTGDCASTFSDRMLAANPVKRDDHSVRDAVAACDSVAGEYVNSPNFGQLGTAGIIAVGLIILLALAGLFMIVLGVTVLFTLWQSGKLVGASAVAILPAVGAYAMWKSFLGIYVGGIMIAVAVVFLAGYLRIISSVMTATSGDGGLPIGTQMLIVSLLMVCLAIALVYVWWRTHKAGDTLAQRLSRFGLGNYQHTPSPVLASAKRVGEHLIARRLAHRPHRPSRTPHAIEKPEAAAGNIDPVNLIANRIPGGADGVTRLTKSLPAATRTVKALTTGGQVAAATATGGSSAVVMGLTKVAGGYVLQRAVASRMGRGRGTSQYASAAAAPGHDREDRPTYTGFGRRIVVDSAGAVRVEPAAAPVRGGVYRITTAPRPRHRPPDSDARRRLRAAVDAAKARTR